MSMTDVNRVRKTLLKKDKSKTPEFLKAENDYLRGKFLTGCAENDFPEGKAIKLWDDILAFGGYAFNKSLHYTSQIPIYSHDGIQLGSKQIDKFDGDEFVRLRDEQTKEDVFIRVDALHDHGTIEMVEAVLEDGSVVRCTPDHKFRVTDGRMLSLKQILGDGLEIVSSVASAAV